MKKCIVMLLFVAVVIGYTHAQAKGNETASAGSNEFAVVIKNLCENRIVVFAGPKEAIRDPKVSVFGGLSLNKVYVREGDVICLMTDESKPKSCTVVKSGLSQVEVNPSATNISTR
ncbi:MAG: hypothetical protein NZM35_10715 [Chitinophagales bacterium]|nr:hypothetical protein [Chitinophagales bacterium]MDW8420144.1 hypothetical protein [Chitinophagales bacterium]